MADKKLIIGSQFDSKGLAAAEKALKRLRSESEGFNKAFKSLADPKNTRAQAMFAKEVMNSASGMGKLKLATRRHFKDNEGSLYSSFK